LSWTDLKHWNWY